MLKKIIAFSAISAMSLPLVNADVSEVDCSTDSVFAQYSCNQCFD
jgi:hypothetical protein